MTDRRYDVDWLRVIAIFALIFYHSLIGFQDFGPWIGWITSDQRLNYLWPLAEMINVWRIPLLFVVSGMGLGFAARRRDRKALLADRAVRIGVPAILGYVVVGPLTVLPGIIAGGDDFLWVPNFAHLWFLVNILVYSVMLIPLANALAAEDRSRFSSAIRGFMTRWYSLLLLPLLFLIEVLLIQPDPFSGYAGTAHGFLLGFFAYAFGLLLVSAGKEVWKNIRIVGLGGLVGAVLLYSLRVIVSGMRIPGILVGVESAMWVLAILALAGLLLNRDSRMLRYLSEAVYPVYIFHLPIENALSLWIFRLEVPGEIQYLLLALGTVGLSFGLFEAVKRVVFLRPMFGMKAQSG